MKQVHIVFNLILLCLAFFGCAYWLYVHVAPINRAQYELSIQYALLVSALVGSLQLSFSTLYYQGSLQNRFMLFFFQWGMLCWVAGMLLWIAGTYVAAEDTSLTDVADYVFNFAPLCWVLGSYYWTHLLPVSSGSKYNSSNIYFIPFVMACIGFCMLFFFGSRGSGALIDNPVLSLFSMCTSSMVLFMGSVIWWTTRRDAQIQIFDKRNGVLLMVASVLYFLADLQELAARAAYQIYDGSLSDITFLAAITLLSISMARMRDPFPPQKKQVPLTTDDIMKNFTKTP